MTNKVDNGAREDDKGGSAGRQLVCPTCGAPPAAPAATGGKSPRPFCSRRCADIDLGRWFQGRYAIPAVDASDDTIMGTLAVADLPDQDAP